MRASRLLRKTAQRRSRSHVSLRRMGDKTGLLVEYIRSPRVSVTANGSNEVWYVPPQSPCFLRPCWTAFLNSLQPSVVKHQT